MVSMYWLIYYFMILFALIYVAKGSGSAGEATAKV